MCWSMQARFGCVDLQGSFVRIGVPRGYSDGYTAVLWILNITIQNVGNLNKTRLWANLSACVCSSTFLPNNPESHHHRHPKIPAFTSAYVERVLQRSIPCNASPACRPPLRSIFWDPNHRCARSPQRHHGPSTRISFSLRHNNTELTLCVNLRKFTRGRPEMR